MKRTLPHKIEYDLPEVLKHRRSTFVFPQGPGHEPDYVDTLTPGTGMILPATGAETSLEEEADDRPLISDFSRDRSDQFADFDFDLPSLSNTDFTLMALGLLEPVKTVQRRLEERIGRSHEVNIEVTEDEVYDPPQRVSIEARLRGTSPEDAVEIEDQITDWIFDNLPSDIADRILLFIRPV